jgi:glyoxylase-like metal-dependent hydrolase (beta-lactamase superfamily II)
MNRRSLLIKSLAAGATSLFPLSTLLAQEQKMASPTNDNKPTGFRQFLLGDLELTILTDGYIKQSPVYPFVAPLATAEAVKTLLEANFRPTDSIELALNVMVVKSKDRLILLDTGMGIFASSIQGRLLTSLADAGFKASDFTDVILSHGHPDHIGGLVDKQSNLVFANADLYMATIEYNFWEQATVEDFKNSPLYKMQDFVKQTISGIQNVLKTIQPKLKFIDVEKGLHDIFSFQLAPGHTPGLTMTTITSNNEKLTFIADLIHSDALLFAHPEWGFTGDTNIQQAVASRIKMLQQLTTNKTKTFAYHLPYPGLGHVRKKDNAFEWVPEVYATP